MKESRQILIAQLSSLMIGLFVGILLSTLKEEILLIPGLLIILPGFLGMRGNISGTLSARLSSCLHLGSIKPFKKSNILTCNIISSSLLTMIAGLFLGFIAFLFNLLINEFYPKIILISLLAAFFSGILMIPITITSVFYLFKKGYDPDNIMGPSITIIGDLITVLSIIFAVMIL